MGWRSVAPADSRARGRMYVVTVDGLTRESLRRVLGLVDEPGPLRPAVEEEVACDGYIRRLVSYDVPAGRASAYVCVPDRLARPAPVV